eukprot:3608324-Amphidinium_carterae.1
MQTTVSHQINSGGIKRFHSVTDNRLHGVRCVCSKATTAVTSHVSPLRSDRRRELHGWHM